MTEAAATTTTTEPGAEAGAPTGEETTETKPPWGSAEEFDPEKAWNLIQNLRGDLDKAKPAVQKLQQLEDEKLTESERLTKERDEALTGSSTTSLENAKLRAILDSGGVLTADDFDLIGGSTPDEVKEAAAKLATRLGSGTQQSTLTNRPGERPRGGSDPTGTTTESKDWLREALTKSD